jgi:competence protein ComK
LEIRDDYIINELTVFFTGEYGERGELFTRVIEGKDTFLVRKSPAKLIEAALLRVGSNLQGALHSSKNLLGTMRMYPVSVNPHLGILLVPSKSMKKHNCVWFSLIHVKNTHALGVRKTEIFTSFGHTILVEMKESAFHTKLQKAIQLREMITKNTKCPLNFYLEKRNGFYISKDPGDNNYRFEKR